MGNTTELVVERSKLKKQTNKYSGLSTRAKMISLMVAFIALVHSMVLNASAGEITKPGEISQTISCYNESSNYKMFIDKIVASEYIYSNGMYYPKNGTRQRIVSYTEVLSNPGYGGPGMPSWFYMSIIYNGMYIWDLDASGSEKLVKLDGDAHVSCYFDAYYGVLANISIPVTRTQPTYSVTYAETGDINNISTSGEYAEGQTVAVKSNPSRLGYTFSGWSTIDTSVLDGSFIMPAMEVLFKGVWTAHTNIAYRVEFYKED